MSKISPGAQQAVDRIASECALRDTRILNRCITQWYEDALRPMGLRSTQLTLLVAVGKIGPIRPADLAPALAMEKSTLSRNTERLLENGWLKSTATDDARSQLLALSPAGGRLLEKALPRWEIAQDLARQALSAGGMASLAKLSRKAQRALQS